MHQFVTITSGGERVKQSTRKATFVTVDELVDDVGADVFRFFMIERKPDGHLDFDLDLAKDKNWRKNPAYYVQYAHARTHGIERKAEEAGVAMPTARDFNAGRLDLEEEIELVKKLQTFPEVVARAAQTREPHHVAYYLREVAGLWNPYLQDGDRHRVLSDDAELTAARLGLALAIRTCWPAGSGCSASARRSACSGVRPRTRTASGGGRACARAIGRAGRRRIRRRTGVRGRARRARIARVASLRRESVGRTRGPIDRGEGDLAEDAGTSAPALAEAAPDGRQGVSPEERALDSALPGVAAAASEAKAPRTARPSAEARAAAAPAAPARMTTPRRPEVSDRATAERRWSIQVGAFGDAAAAERLADGLRNRYPVAVLPARETGGRWRVRIQPIAGEDEARTMADRLKRDEHLPTWVTPMESGSDS